MRLKAWAKRRARAWAKSQRATAAIEFALISSSLLLFIGGLMEFGRIFQIYEAVNRVATQYAIAWADCSDSPAGTCSTELSSFTATNAIANFAPQLKTASLTLNMFQVTMVGTTPTVVYSYPSGASLNAAQVAAAQAAISAGQSGVVVSASYNHTLLYFPKLLGPMLNSYLTPSYTVAQLKS